MKNLGRIIPNKTIILQCDIQTRFKSLVYGIDSVIGVAQMMS